MSCSDPAVYILTGILPIEAPIHIKALTFLIAPYRKAILVWFCRCVVGTRDPGRCVHEIHIRIDYALSLALVIHMYFHQLFMESVLFIYVFFFSSCVALPIACPSMISCFRCSGPFFGEYDNYGVRPIIR
jgi:hypothetical protein